MLCGYIVTEIFVYAIYDIESVDRMTISFKR